MRLRMTAFPTAFGTAKPRRGSPIVSSRWNQYSVRNRVETERPWRETASKSRERERRFRRCTGLRREPLAALRPAPLEDRLAGTGRHAGTETVLPLASADVGLVGAFHTKEPTARPAAGEYSRTVSRVGYPQGFWRAKAVESGVVDTDFSHTFHSCGELCGGRQKTCKYQESARPDTARNPH